MNWAPAHIPPRVLREVYLHPFEAAVREAGLESIMAGYHELDGVPCHANHELVTDLVRGEWGFTGTIVSDYFAVEELFSYHQLAGDSMEAAGLALSAGVDVELPSTDAYGEPLARAVSSGHVGLDVIDTAVARVLRHKIELGLFEHPYVDEDGVDAAVNTAEHREIAVDIARRSLVLLKNDRGILPLAADVASVALIGPNADDARNLLGDYSFPAHVEALAEARQRRGLLGEMMTIPDDLEIEEGVDGISTIRGELATRLGDRLLFTRGCGVLDPPTDGFDEAVATAAAAEVAILVLGDRSGLTTQATTGEARDRASLDLPGVQEELVRAVAATGTPIVAVLVAGRPVGSDFLHEHCAAVLMAWLPGECGAQAVAETLLGHTNPSGKLPISYPRAVGQVPVYYGHKLSGGRSHWHGDYVDLSTRPRYAFGHGLTYSTFELEQATLARTEVPAGESLDVEAVVANTGDVTGEEVLQLYIRDCQASVTRPVLELKSFVRVSAEPGDRKAVRFRLPAGQLGFYGRDMAYTVEPGSIEVHLGFSSDALVRVGTFTIVDNGDGGAVHKQYTGAVDVRAAGEER